MRAQELEQLLYLRPEVTSDHYVCGQVVSEYKYLNLDGKRVFDIGGSIGAFSVYAYLMGATEIFTYEPDPYNFNSLEINTSNLENIHIFEGAMIYEKQERTKFYLTKGLARDGFSTIKFKDRDEIEVKAYNFQEELQTKMPQVIKMDIEGGEFDLLIKSLPKFVEEIVVEIHFSKPMFRTLFKYIEYIFRDWETVIKPKENGKNFHTLAHWRRRASTST